MSSSQKGGAMRGTITVTLTNSTVSGNSTVEIFPRARSSPQRPRSRRACSPTPAGRLKPSLSGRKVQRPGRRTRRPPPRPISAASHGTPPPDLGAFEAGAKGGLKLVGGPGADVLVSGAGDDRIYGKGGNELLRGLAGDDLLRGGTGDDLISGGRGGDRVSGGMGDDMLYGGRGHDVFVFGPDPGADTIVGFDANPWRGQDRMDLRALGISAASFASAVTIDQTGDDTRITLQGEGSILCRGIDGAGGGVIDKSDFLLLT